MLKLNKLKVQNKIGRFSVKVEHFFLLTVCVSARQTLLEKGLL